jgi:hypothetical protein
VWKSLPSACTLIASDAEDTTQQLTAYLKPIELVRYAKNATKESAGQTTIFTLIDDRFSTILKKFPKDV